MPSQAFTGVHNGREPLGSERAAPSNGLKYEAPIVADLFHQYFKPLLTVSEIAGRLGLCAATVYKLCSILERRALFGGAAAPSIGGSGPGDPHLAGSSRRKIREPVFFGTVVG
jgi:hypothetical protein